MTKKELESKSEELFCLIKKFATDNNLQVVSYTTVINENIYSTFGAWRCDKNKIQVANYSILKEIADRQLQDYE